MTLCNCNQVRLGTIKFKEQSVKTTCEMSNDRFGLETTKWLR
jgi:hypothetical protein